MKKTIFSLALISTAFLFGCSADAGYGSDVEAPEWGNMPKQPGGKLYCLQDIPTEGPYCKDTGISFNPKDIEDAADAKEAAKKMCEKGIIVGSCP